MGSNPTPRTLNEYTYKVAKTVEETTQPIELGFEYVTEIDEANFSENESSYRSIFSFCMHTAYLR